MAVIHQLLWVNKGARSEKLSQSSTSEAAQIRQHVQRTRRVNRHNNREPACRKNTTTRDGTQLQSTLPQCKRVACVRADERCFGLPPSASLPIALHWSPCSTLSYDERRSLAFYKTRTCREWPGWRDHSFWSCFVLQCAERSQAVAHSLISLSAFHESHNLTALGIACDSMRNLGLAQSIKASQEACKAGITFVDALTSCLILFCIGGLQGSRNVYRLLESGFRLLAECNCSSTHSTTIAAARQEVSIVNEMIRPLFDRLRGRICAMTDLASAINISIQHRSESDEDSQSWRTHAWPTIPSAFADIEAAKDCLDAILKAAHASVPSAGSESCAVQSFSRNLRARCISWSTALGASDIPEQVHPDLPNQGAKNLLRASLLLGRILLETSFTPDQMVYDQYHSEFSQILDLVQSTLVGSVTLGIDNGLIDMLAFIGCKCRDPAIRRRATRILLQGGRAEGDRIACMPGLILQTIIDLEEKNIYAASSTDIPAARRLSIVSGRVFQDHGLIRLRLCSTTGEILERNVLTNRPRKAPMSSSAKADAIFQRGCAAFYDEESGAYHYVDSTAFYFPIPRV